MNDVADGAKPLEVASIEGLGGDAQISISAVLMGRQI
jgi:hypothetical protein